MNKFKENGVLIITWFEPGTIGYLDFEYRISSILKKLSALVICNIALAREALAISEDSFLHLPTQGNSIGQRLSYYLRVSQIQKEFGYKQVILLHSSLAHLPFFLRNCDTYLYWNEHPTHLYPLEGKGRFSLLQIIKNKFMRYLMYRGAIRSTFVMPIGEHHQKDLLENGCSPRQVVLLYMGVDVNFIAPEYVSDINASNELRVIYTGSVHPDRGRDLMLHALSYALNFGALVNLTIVGADDEQSQYCKNLANRLNISDAVTIVGRIPGDKIPSHLHQSDVGLCFWEDKPYWRYNPPTKLFEYLVAGLPVIASDIRTHSAYIRNGETGFLCDYSFKALGEVLKILALDRLKLTAMKEAARKEGEQYLWPRLEPKLMEILSNTLKNEKVN